MKEVIQRLIQAGSAAEHLEHTRWLDESSPEEVEARYHAYSEKCQKAADAVRGELGEPRYPLPADGEWFSQWYPEAFAGAAWETKDGWLCLAAEHPDRETSISLLVRSVTAQEWDELAE